MKGKKMILQSKTMGRLEVDDASLLYCAGGLVGFEEYKRYYLAEVPEYGPFLWLMSADEPDLGFAVADPQLFYPGEYEVNLGEADRDALDLQPGDTISVFVIISVLDGGRRISANLKGPVVLNTRNRMCRQVVIYNPAYSVRQSLLTPGEERIPLVECARGRVAARG
jgi:flagellar assembly factor FliW